MDIEINNNDALYCVEKVNKTDKHNIIATIRDKKGKNDNGYILIKDKGDNKNVCYNNLIEINDNMRDKYYFNFVPMVPDNMRYGNYIFSVSGAGKSTYVGRVLREMRNMERYTDLPIYMINPSQGIDDAYKDIENMIPIDIYDDTFLQLSNEDFINSIVIFDDIEDICSGDDKKDKQISRKIWSLINSISKINRKKNTHYFWPCHDLAHQHQLFCKSVHANGWLSS